MSSTRKQIAFDLDTKVCKQIMGKKYNHIYDIIRKHMEEEGFEHRQGSVYISVKPMKNMEVNNIMLGLVKKYPAISKCIRDITQTNVGKSHVINKCFDYDGTAGKFKRFDIDEQKTANKGINR